MLTITMANAKEQAVEFPDGVIATIDALRAQDRRRGVIRTVDGAPVLATRTISAQTGRQRRVDGKYGWTITGHNVNLYYGRYLGEYRAGTRIITDYDPTSRQSPQHSRRE